MIIRPIRQDEIDNASAIVKNNYGEEYAQTSRVEIDAMFHNPTFPPKYLVAEDNGKMIGFAGFCTSWMDYHVSNLFWVNVEPEHQRKGIGSKLVEAVINEIKSQEDPKQYMIQLTTTKPRFYEEKFGFRTLATFGPKNHSLMALKINQKP